MRRNCLSLAKQRSMRLRSRYSALSQARGCWQLRGGITGWAPSEWICATSCRLSWPLSAKTHLGLNPASSAGACVMSLRWPPVRINRTGRPWPSTAMGSSCSDLLGNAPEPGALPPFSGRRLCVRPDNAAVDHQILVASILNQGLGPPLPDALGRPAGEALVHALAGSVARRQITPARPGAQHPQHAIDEAAVVRCRTPRVTGLAWE